MLIVNTDLDSFSFFFLPSKGAKTIRPCLRVRRRRQQGNKELERNGNRARRHFRKLETAVFLQPLKHNAATHTAPAVSITAMWPQREQYICRRDQVLNRPCQPLNPSRHSLRRPQQSPQNPSTWPSQPRFIQDILPLSARKTLPSPVQTVKRPRGACYYHSCNSLSSRCSPSTFEMYKSCRRIRRFLRKSL